LRVWGLRVGGFGVKVTLYILGGFLVHKNCNFEYNENEKSNGRKKIAERI
jgi:hypothetical protein